MKPQRPPIGPPQKTNSNPPPPSMLAPGSGRRQSIADPGPIGPPRPIQPISRLTEQSGSRSASPVRRSPSPKVLGSSALATEDDEVVLTSRRTTINGPVWGAAPVPPRSSVDLRGPWDHLRRLDFPFNLRASLGLPLDHLLGEQGVRTINGTPPTSFLLASSLGTTLPLPPTPETEAIAMTSCRLSRTIFTFSCVYPPGISPPFSSDLLVLTLYPSIRTRPTIWEIRVSSATRSPRIIPYNP